MKAAYFFLLISIFIATELNALALRKTASQVKTEEGQGSFRQFEDEDEDEEEETTVKGPGHEGILKGLSGIFTNVVKGNANGVVESTFNFVPPVYQKDVNSAYGTIVGRPTTVPPTTTPPASPPTEPTNPEAEVEEPEGGVEPAASKPKAPTPSKGSASSVIRKRPAPIAQALQPVRKPISTGDDEEDESLGIQH